MESVISGSRVNAGLSVNKTVVLMYLTDPQFSYEFPMEYLERVKKTHESGGFGSIG